MATENQKIVIEKIKSKVGKGKISVSKEMRGIYADSVAKIPGKLTKSKGFQEEMKPVVEQMEKERQRAISLLKTKISKAQYHQLVDGIDKLTKNIQLLSGGATEKLVLEIPKAVADTFNLDAINRETRTSDTEQEQV